MNTLIAEAVRYSPHVRAIGDQAVVAETFIGQAKGEFDPTAFLESKFIRTSVPTGSTLDAGVGVARLREEDWSSSAGVRKKNRLGGQLELAQQFGLKDSNSNFFIPTDQGNSRLTLRYDQPLLNGAGRAYNSSLIVLAELDAQVASNRTAAELQDHLLDVTAAYWELYLQRVAFLQKGRHLARADRILDRLESRRGIDSLASQITRARAAVSMRRAEMIRAEAAVLNVEARLRALVNSPKLVADRRAELVPLEPPAVSYAPVDLEDALATALEFRPEVEAASQEIEAARVRVDVSREELLPVLDLVLETYVSGLRGNYYIPESWRDQFTEGEPSYTAGFVFEVPLGRRAAKSRHLQRRLELRRLVNQFEATVATLGAEVEVAVRDVETAYRSLQSQYHAMAAAESDVNYLQRRWELLPGEDRAASFVLEDLLDAQDRLMAAEFNFAEAQVEYVLSRTRFNRATGVLLQHEQIDWRHCRQGDEPALQFRKRNAPSPDSAQPTPVLIPPNPADTGAKSRSREPGQSGRAAGNGPFRDPARPARPQ